MYVALDTDRNAGTGYAGSEYQVVYWRDATTALGELDRWDGAHWQRVPGPALRSTHVVADTVTWQLERSAIGNPVSFDFSLVSSTVDAAWHFTGYDVAPDSGVWTYLLSAAPLTTTVTDRPAIGAAGVVPARPTAGAHVSVTFPVTLAGHALTSADLTGGPTLAGKPLTHTESFANGRARFSFHVPRTAKGKRIVVRLTVTPPDYWEDGGTYVNPLTGQTGRVYVEHVGQTATRKVSLLVR